MRTTLYPAPEDRSAVCGRVVDEKGVPVADTLALLFRADDSGEYRLLSGACTDSAGYFAFGPLEPEALYYIKLTGNAMQLRELELRG